MIIVISGYNQRAVVAFLRCLKKNCISDYSIIARDNNDPILFSEYSSHVIYIRKNKELDKEELYPVFKQIVDLDINKTIIVPSTEALNRFLVKNKMEIESLGVCVPLVDENLYVEISDKRSFCDMCKQFNLKIPQTIHLKEYYSQKYVAKPISYISPSGQRHVPIIVDNANEHEEFLSNYNLNEFDIQEYIEGESYYLLYYFARNGVDYSFSQRNLAQQPGGKSIIAAMCSNIHEESIAQEYISMLKSKGFWGFCMIELRKCMNDYIMIEANPRMWGPSQLYVDANIPFIEAFLFDYDFLDCIPSRSVNFDAKYYWSTGVKKDILNDEHCVWLDGGKKIVARNLEVFYKFDMYKRVDTMGIYTIEKDAWEKTK